MRDTQERSIGGEIEFSAVKTTAMNSGEATLSKHSAYVTAGLG
ncbi:hypothetical protein VUT03_19360 [Pseudomonas aeruginosa]|nr:hypothetical protein Q094_06931 [Pseudomonas aeruginosa PS42]CRP50437.1 hypothetical protein PAERUG_P26_Wales_1_VIM_2_11_10_05466 [Pseudomonas aeruginosa]CRP78085.1 hypothetical protein PAERUG_P27_Wales_1_VIM_2_02_11_05342 [Pseudomonas aeruginosa]